MVKEKRILSYFIGWLIVGFIVCFLGINNILALTNKTIYSSVTDNGLSGSGYYNYGYINAGGIQNTTTGAVGATINGKSYGFQFYYYEDIILNNTYTLKINFNDNDLLKNVNSNYFDIKTCTNNNCSNAIIISLEKSNNNGNSNWVLLKFNPVDIGNIVSVDIGSDNNEAITGIDNFGISSIQTEYSNANQDIIDNNNNNTNNIIDNNNNNTQNIIDSNNEIKDTINENFNSCRDSYNLLYTPYTVDNKLTDTAIRDDYFSALNYYATLQAGKTYTFSVETDGQWGSTTGSDTVEVLLLKGPNYSYYITMTSNPFTFIPQESGDFYIRYDINQNSKTHSFWNFQIVEGSSSKKWEQAGVQVCQNKIDETNDKLDETNQNLGDIKDSLTDSSPTDMSGLGDSAGWLPPGPVDSILNLPLTFFLNLSESLESECRPVELTLPFVNEKIYLPCIRTLYDKMGVTGTIFTTAGVIASAVILFNYLLALYKWVDDTLTMRENTMPGYYEDKWGGGA